MPKYGVISGPYFPVFSPNTGDTFHTVNVGDSQKRF